MKAQTRRAGLSALCENHDEECGRVCNVTPHTSLRTLSLDRSLHTPEFETHMLARVTKVTNVSNIGKDNFGVYRSKWLTSLET